MILEAIATAVFIALLSVVGVLFFGHDKRLIGAERFVVPVAAGVFLSLVLNELLPEALSASPEWGGTVVIIGFLAFYILSHKLHQRFHHLETEDCNRKGAASLLLIGDGIHNFADGIILGGAFLIDPTVGVATAVGLAMHEIPQEIVEFGVLIRAGYTRAQAVSLNLLSASTVVLGTVVVLFLYNHADDYVWILVGLAAGNMLYLSASDLLPRIHGNLSHYGSIWRSTISIIVGFALMTVLLSWVHDNFETGESHEQASYSAH